MVQTFSWLFGWHDNPLTRIFSIYCYAKHSNVKPPLKGNPQQSRISANNVVVVCRLHYINTLKQELNGTLAYEQTSIDEKSAVFIHSNEIPSKFAVDVKERQDRLPTMFWLPKLHKRPYKAKFIANSSSCTTTELS